MLPAVCQSAVLCCVALQVLVLQASKAACCMLWFETSAEEYSQDTSQASFSCMCMTLGVSSKNDSSTCLFNLPVQKFEHPAVQFPMLAACKYSCEAQCKIIHNIVRCFIFRAVYHGNASTAICQLIRSLLSSASSGHCSGSLGVKD